LSISASTASADHSLGALFLVCRLHTLHKTLEALEPLRELADQESARRINGHNASTKQAPQPSALGSQSERYLKKYVEIFREQSFAIVSMYKSIFPTGLPSPETVTDDIKATQDDPFLPMPASVSTFALHLVDMLMEELRQYMPNVTDKQSRESLWTQVLYCAGSLGRLGADFGMMVALLEEGLAGEQSTESDEGEEPEWVQVMKKHRIQASRLEVLARGVGSGRKASMDVQSPTASSAA
jgi:conserved oligomeric Golgi complex subunit 8